MIDSIQADLLPLEKTGWEVVKAGDDELVPRLVDVFDVWVFGICI